MKRHKKMNKTLKKFITALLVIILLIGAYALTVNFYVILSQDEKIFTRDEITVTEAVDYILVLGCGIKDGKPSHMLEDRLYEGMAVAEKYPDAKLLLSGDNSGPEYNEVGAMVEFCLEHGFAEERIETDDTGFSTGESMDNFLNNHKGSKVIVITQHYHLYRALFITERLGIDAVGIPSNPRKYSRQLYFSLREVAARNKDFLKYQF